VLVLARERGEHANPFHAMTDCLNACFALHLAGVVDGVSGARAGADRVQLLLLDEQAGPYDLDAGAGSFLKRVFAPVHGVVRASDLQRRAAEGAAGGAQLVMRHAVFAPPGYSNMLLAHVSSEGDCHQGTHLLQSFRRFVLAAFPATAPLLAADWAAAAAAGEPVRVTLVSRRPYTTFVEHKFIGRQFDNEDEILQALRAERGVAVERVDFAGGMAVEAQLATVARTEVLVGMHGAALTYALYMPPHGAVVELWPKGQDMWRCFEHAAAMAGLQYARWANADPGAFREDAAGDYTRVNVGELMVLVRSAVAGARDRRGTRVETRPRAPEP
jgi:hypothetical protein